MIKLTLGNTSSTRELKCSFQLSVVCCVALAKFYRRKTRFLPELKRIIGPNTKSLCMAMVELTLKGTLFATKNRNSRAPLGYRGVSGKHEGAPPALSLCFLWIFFFFVCVGGNSRYGSKPCKMHIGFIFQSITSFCFSYKSTCWTVFFFLSSSKMTKCI